MKYKISLAISYTAYITGYPKQLSNEYLSIEIFIYQKLHMKYKVRKRKTLYTNKTLLFNIH